MCVVCGAQLVRFPTPFRRDMNKKKKKLNKYKPGATPTTTIFKKGCSQVQSEYMYTCMWYSECTLCNYYTFTYMYMYYMYMYIQENRKQGNAI